jgi:hypothetical protein
MEDRSMELVRFVGFVVKLAICLALIGELKSCTLELLDLTQATSDFLGQCLWTRLLQSN